MKKNKKRKLSIKKIVLFVFIILFAVFLLIKGNFNKKEEIAFNTLDTSITNSSEYSILKQDTNSNYLGVGQEKVDNKDGYFTTFTTENNKVYKEYKQNGNSSWSNHSYWDDVMATDGCAITAMSIILSGYENNTTPEDLRQLYFPVLNGDNIASELNKTFGITNSDFFYDEYHLSNSYIEKYLKTDKPILICVWNKPHNNRWTTASHYMVLLATDSNGMVYVSNPNGLENNSKSSGWYNINEVSPYIAKALFIEK